MDLRVLREFVRRLVERLEVQRGLSLVLISNRAMRRVYLTHVGKDRPTDVLAFPHQPEPWEAELDDEYAGDVLISVQTADRQKKGPLIDELKVLSLHGILHLLGYDHASDGGEMNALEKTLRQEFKLH